MKPKGIEHHPELKKFLDEVCGQIRNRDNRDKVRDELLSHFEAELAAYDGDFEENLKLVLSQFGDPKVLGQNLHVARRTWPQTLINVCVLSLVASFAMSILASGYLTSRYKKILKTTSDVAILNFSRFKDAQREISNFDFLVETSAAKRDAGAFLNSRVMWHGFDQSVEIAFPDVSTTKWTQDWLVAEIPQVLKNVDLYWIRKLRDFDHWDVFKHGPNAHLVGERPRLVNPYQVPLPDFLFFSEAVKLHLRRALDQRNVTQALHDVRHLARLVYSTETLVGSMTMAHLLTLELAAYEAAIKRGLAVADDYRPIPRKTIEKIKETVWVTSGFADHSAPEVMAHVFLKSEWPVGSCAALAEMAQGFVLTSEFLNKKFPLEFDNGEIEATVHRVFEASKSRCRLTFHRQVVERSKTYVDFVFRSQQIGDWSNLETLKYAYGRHLPYLRQGFGMELMAIARPDFLRVYDHK